MTIWPWITDQVLHVAISFILYRLSHSETFDELDPVSLGFIYLRSFITMRISLHYHFLKVQFHIIKTLFCCQHINLKLYDWHHDVDVLVLVTSFKYYCKCVNFLTVFISLSLATCTVRSTVRVDHRRPHVDLVGIHAKGHPASQMLSVERV